MTLADWLANLGAWSAQVAALVAVAAVVAAGLRLTLPRARLALWQALLVACLALPLVQPWLPAPVTSMSAGAFGARLDAVPAADTTPAPNEPVAPTRSGLPLGQALAAVLVLGALARLGWLGLGFVRLARLRRTAVPLGRVPASIDRAVGLSGADAALALTDAIDGPVTFGLRRPVVLLPQGFFDLSPDFQTTIVCHELAHVRRRDWAWTLGEAFVTAAFWFHPAVWWLVAEIQVSREAVIDREVVEITGARKPYLEALVHLASEGARPAMVPAIPMLGRRHLARRMRLLLSEVPMSKTRLVVSFATIALTLALAGRYTVWAFPLTGPAPAAPALAAQEQQPPATKLKSGEHMPRKIRDVRPVYPDEARKARVQGVVILEVTIETDGTVSATKVLRSVPMFDQAAVDAVRQWRFENVSHRVLATVTVAFKLDDGAKAAAEPKADAKPGQTPVKVYDVRPEYPEEARKQGVSGVVVLELTIDPDGHVSDVEVLRVGLTGVEPDVEKRGAIPALDKAAIDAVRQWRYEPTGRTYKITATVAFKLDDEKTGVATAPGVKSGVAGGVEGGVAGGVAGGEAGGVARMDVAVTRTPKAIHEVKPRYTRELMETGVQGEVVIEMQVGTDGTVTDARVVSGPDELREAALDAARQWRFEPPEKLTTVQISFTFTMK